MIFIKKPRSSDCNSLKISALKTANSYPSIKDFRKTKV